MDKAQAQMTNQADRMQAWNELHSAAMTLRHFGLPVLAEQVDHAAANISRNGRINRSTNLEEQND